MSDDIEHDREHIYKQSEYDECPDCGTDLKRFSGAGAAASAEGYGSRRAERIVYCPKCSPRNILEKFSNNLESVWDDL